MRTLITLLLVIFASALPASASTSCRALPSETQDAFSMSVDQLVDDAVEKGFAGGVTVIEDGKLLYSRVAGFSDAGKTVAVTDSTLFHVASITKYLTAILVLKAAEEGKLAVDDALAEYFPGTAMAERGTTISDLLAHRSGLGSSYAAESHAEPSGAVAAIDAAGIDELKVGTFRYSNDGYDLLAIILETAYGEPYGDIARRLLLARACLDHAGFWGEGDLLDPSLVSQPLNSPSEALLRRNYGMIGSAGFLVTARDLARLQLSLAEERVLSPASLSELWAPRGATSIGEATYGAFLLPPGELGPFISARGFEDWGDNAVLNHHRDRGLIVAVTTSKGPAEGTAPPWRDTLSKSVERLLAARAALP